MEFARRLLRHRLIFDLPPASKGRAFRSALLKMRGNYGGQFIPADIEDSAREACAMKSLCLQFLRDETGATAIEYGLIVSCITVAILGTLQSLSTSVKTVLFDVVAAAASP